MAKAKGQKLAAAAEKAYEKVKARSKLGEGKRFRALSKALAAKGAKDPDALAAWIGRKKLGRKRMAGLAAAGRKKS